MKKYFKLQAKKSLSLFLAVLMLLSCWVWVAPQDAYADQTTGQYKIRVAGHVTDNMDAASSSCTWKVTLSDDTTVNLTDNGSVQNSNSGKAALTNEVWVSSFPKSLYVSLVVSCGDHDGGRIEKNALQVYNFTNNTWVDLHNEEAYNCDKNKTTSYTFNVDTTLNPEAKGLSDKTVYEITMPNIKELGTSNDVVSVGFTAVKVLDQYGVTIDTPSYSLVNANGTEYDSSYGIWIEGTTVKANSTVQQTLMSTETGKMDVYVKANASEASGNIAKIALQYPTYNVKFEHRPKKVGSTDTYLDATMVLNSGTATVAKTYTGYYGAKLTEYPTGTATKEGYNFYGFWSKQQPDSGNASYNESTANFATPVSTTDFENYVKAGGTVNGNYVTVKDADGNETKYYNAGTPWTADSSKEIKGHTTYYGWWLSKEITVSFYDIDGTYLGTQTTKYGVTEGEGFYPPVKETYDAGAFKYDAFQGQWRDISGKLITEGEYTFGPIESLKLTPVYSKKTYNQKYNITFVISDSETKTTGYDYRHILDKNNIPTPEMSSVLSNDKGYSYEFAGWTTQEPEKDENGNFVRKYIVVSANDTSVAINEDWVVRKDVTYYPVFRSTVKEYVFNFKYFDSTGAEKTLTQNIAYGSVISTPDEVNLTYAGGGLGYTLTLWEYYKGMDYMTFDFDKSVVFNSDNFAVVPANLADGVNEVPIVFTAAYKSERVPYTVTFKYKDENGINKNYILEVQHGYEIGADAIADLVVPAQYDDGNALYTFSNLWKVTEGTASKAEYSKDEFATFKPTSHITFEAMYGEGVPFYNVTYIDGAKIFTERVLAGKKLPAWTTEVDGVEVEYIPTKADAATGQYIFEGWFNEAQTDADFAQTNGTEYTTDSVVESDLVLYPQFKFSAFKYTILFMNHDGSVQLSSAYVEAGQSFEEAFARAQKGAQTREKDETYTYTFIGWDYKVPENYLCEGKDIVYTALYKTSYRYYEGKWYNSKEEMSGTPLATTKHTYNSAVNAPSVTFNLPQAEAGFTSVFAGWKYLDKDNVERDFERGIKITADMSFYATYESVAKPVSLTTVIDGVSTTISLKYGEAAIVADPADGYVDADKHKDFDGWYADADYETPFDVANTPITTATTIYAKFTESGHDKSFKEIVEEPTYYKEGKEIIWCACDKSKTKTEVAIPMLTDTVAPTGTIYLGTLGKWSSTETDPTKTGAGDTNIYYANANTDIVLLVNDTGDVNNAFNPAGTGKGIKKVLGMLSATEFGTDTTEMVGIRTLFEAEAGDQTFNNSFNYVLRLRDYGNLVDGETYIAYYYVIDKAGNELNRNVRTAKFIYDTSAPVITVTGSSKDGITYCAEATFAVEEGATVTLNGNPATVENGVCKITAADNYTITVTDRAGNTASKKITVVEDHDEIATYKEATCDEDGYIKVTCALCGETLEDETIASTGHSYGEPVKYDPTCDEAGYEVTTCSKCGDEVKTVGEPATGHTYAKDGEEILYTNIVLEPTCTTVGKATTSCSVCGEGTLTKELPINSDAHLFGAVNKILKATCTENGEEYQNCKRCFTKVTFKTLEKLNHEGTGRYTSITTEPTCFTTGVETTYCKGCNAELSEAEVAVKDHTLVLVTYNSESDKSEEYPAGYMQYECQVEGCTYTADKKAIAVTPSYKVTFKVEGEEDVVITKKAGESVPADAIADPTKDSDSYNNYTFAGWKGTDGRVVKLPISVTKDETYTAEFTPTTRTYTHIFKVLMSDAATISSEENYKVFATIVGVYEDADKKPAKDPTKTATAAATYKFNGWKDTAGNPVDDFTMYGNATFVGDFTAVPNTYSVTYLNGTSAVKVYPAVPYGSTLPACVDDNNEAIIPTKAIDDQNHYTFKGWSVAADTIITTNTQVHAEFNKIPHSYGAGEVIKKATCKETGTRLYTCECGKTKEESIALSTKHEMDGSICTICGYEEKITMVTISFKNDNGSRLHSFNVKPGDTVTYDKVPVKASTAEFDYEFIGWIVEETDVPSMATTFVVNEDIVYTADFKAITKKYTVTYYNDGVLFDQFEDVPYNDNIPATDKVPSKASTSGYHFKFLGWSVNSGPYVEYDKIGNEVVAGETKITADYQTVEHTWSDLVPGTCAIPAHKKCLECGYNLIIEGSTTEDHTYDENAVEIVEPTFDAEGSKKYHCTACNKDIVEPIAKKAYYIINIRVYDDDGSESDYANVKLYHDGKLYELYKNGRDTKDGFVSFKVDKALNKELWTVTIVSPGKIAGGAGGKVTTTSREVGGYVNVFNEPDEEEPETPDVEQEPEAENCGNCKCHKKTFAGMIFRFFRKIIKLFTGKVCCPDADYF